MRQIISRISDLLGCLALITILSVVAHAQFRAGIQGVVTDTAGGTVSGATVTLTSKETNQSQTTATSDDGFYRFSGLAPGLYTVSVELQGFKKRVVDDVKVDAESIKGQDVVLEAGVISETVTVEAQNTAIETENANVQKTITTIEVRNLPQTGRDPYELARLAPGILAPGARSGIGNSVGLPNTTGPGGSNTSVLQSENQVPISAAGQRLSNNNFQIDGVSVTSLQHGGAANITPNQESVKELQIASSSYSAEDGRNSGAQIKVVSQNGTNQFHGSAFFKYNDPGWNAFNKFRGIPGTSRTAFPQRVENRFKQYGGSIGGPLPFLNFGENDGPMFRSGKDRSFFFFSFEGVKNNSSNTSLAWVETEQYRQQVIAGRPGGLTARIFSGPGIAPRTTGTLVRTCLDFFGNANDAANLCRQVPGGLDLGSLTGGLGTITGPTGGGFDNVPDVVFAQLVSPQRTGGSQFNFRTDFNITAKDRLAFIAYFVPRKDTLLSDPAARSRPQADLQNKPFTYSLTGTYNRIFSTKILNEFRANFVRFSQNQIQDSSSTNFGIPRIEIEGPGFNNIGRIIFGAPRADTTPAIFDQRTFEVRDTLTQVLGNHALKYGVEFRREASDNDLSGAARPLFTFPGLFNFANDAAVFELVDVDPRTGEQADARRNFRDNVYGLFVQDDWKFRPNLTVNLGLRYEYYSPVKEANNRLSALVLGTGARTLLDARVQLVDSLTDPDRNNFAPRIGFAYSPGIYKFLENRAVIRGGFGVFYNRVPNVLLTNTRLNPPFFSRVGVCCFSGSGVLYRLGSTNSAFSYAPNPALRGAVDPTTGGLVGLNSEVWGSERRLPNSEVYKYSLDFQYELPYNLVASIGYEGSQSRNLIRLVNLNFFFPPRFATGTTGGFAPIFFVRPDVNANYNGMNARLERRFAQGFQMTANYRFSKSLDQLSFEGPGFVTNQTYPLDQRQEWGPSDYDVRHSFVLAGIYEFPFFRGDKQSWLYRLLGGFEVSGILTTHTGYPWTPLLGAALRTPSGEFFGPIRPTSYNGRQPDINSNSNFLRPNGIFPGGGGAYFGTTPPSNQDFAANPPGIGRNTFRGPKYFSVDMSLAKRFGLPGVAFLGETPNLELRFNFFNVFNQLNLTPFIFGEGNTFVGSSNFGEPTSALAGRVVEFQARFRF